MAKPRKKDDRVKAMVIATLKRAIAVVEGSMVDKSARPDEGGYPVALELGITGDITVGKATPAGEDREVPVFGAGEVLVGILAKRTPAATRKLIAGGLEAAKTISTVGDLAAERKGVAEAIASACEEMGLTKSVPTPGRAGAVSGKPAVTVHGTHGANPLMLEVDAA